MSTTGPFASTAKEHGLDTREGLDYMIGYGFRNGGISDIATQADPEDLFDFVYDLNIEHFVVQEISEQDGCFESTQGTYDLYESYKSLHPMPTAKAIRSLIKGMEMTAIEFVKWVAFQL